jgi:hypothetical protein
MRRQSVKSKFAPRVVASVLLAVVVGVVLALPAMAFATTGDMDHPVFVALPWSQDQTGTFIAGTDGGYPYYEYNYQVALNKGQTVRFTSTTVSDNDSYMFAVADSFAAPNPVFSSIASFGVQTLTLTAQKTGNYDLLLEGSHDGTFSVNSVLGAAAPSYTSFKSLTAPASGKKTKKYTVTAKLKTPYDGVLSPVTFVIQKKKGSKYKTFKTYTSTMGFDGITFTWSGKLAKASYQVKAVFADPVNKTFATKFKKFKIK